MSVIFQENDDMTGIFAQYEVKSFFSFLALEIMNIRTHHITIKQCANCKYFFIPNSRKDEIYCDRIFRNGKTCKQIGYIEKEKYYVPWLAAAQEAQKKYEVTNDIDGFRKWIEDNKNAF